MAIEDPKGAIAWKGKNYKSVLADYPYADDGMLIWNALHEWCSDYLKVIPEASTHAANLVFWRGVACNMAGSAMESKRTINDLCVKDQEILGRSSIMAEGQHDFRETGMGPYTLNAICLMACTAVRYCRNLS